MLKLKLAPVVLSVRFGVVVEPSEVLSDLKSSTVAVAVLPPSFEARKRTSISRTVGRPPGTSASSNSTVSLVAPIGDWMKSLSSGLSMSSSILDEHTVETESVAQLAPSLFVQVPALALSALGSSVLVPLGGVGVAVGVEVDVGVAVAVGVGVLVAVAVGVGVLVAVAVGVGVLVAVAVAVLVAVAVGVGVLVAVAVGVGVLVEVAVGVGVLVAVAVGVGVLVAVAVGVGVLVAVAVGVGVLVAVAVGVGVLVVVAVGVGVLVAVAVGVGVLVDVAVGPPGVLVAVAVVVGVGVGQEVPIQMESVRSAKWPPPSAPKNSPIQV